MRNFLLSLALLAMALPLAHAETSIESAHELAQDGIIVNRSVDSEYHLGDILMRQDAMSVALKLYGPDIMTRNICQKYFLDVTGGVSCRNIELAADQGLISRSNRYFRPHDSLTLGESLIVLLKSFKIPLTENDASNISDSLSAWQEKVILTLQERNISFTLYAENGNVVASSANIIASMSHRMTRGEFFQLVRVFLDHRDSTDPVAHCTVYNDGCNDCSVTEGGVPACTKRACFWEGIPSCSQCETGYHVENNRCVRDQSSCVQEGGYAGGGHVMGPEDPNDFLCCSGLTRAERADGTTFADAGYTCIKQGDNICDAQYESDYNSSDCRPTTTFDSSVCQSYYDGCNSCSKTSSGTICTLRACTTNGPAYCTSYVAYNPKTESEDRTFLGKVVGEMRNYASDLSCTMSSQCHWAMVGARACGGASAAISYSTNTVDQDLIDSKDQYITDTEKAFNERYGIVSECMFIQPPPPLSCVNNLCQYQP